VVLPHPDRCLSFFCQVQQSLCVLQKVTSCLGQDDLFAFETVEQGNAGLFLQRVNLHGDIARSSFFPLLNGTSELPPPFLLTL
jgi:hypothetical protein